MEGLCLSSILIGHCAGEESSVSAVAAGAMYSLSCLQTLPLGDRDNLLFMSCENQAGILLRWREVWKVAFGWA